MLFPISTDAPVYHFPFVTIALIVANVICFVLTGYGFPSNSDTWYPWTLQFGRGWQPQQWVSSLFIHLGILHILISMVFLWGFGLIVEGKLGWWRFLLAFFGLGVLQCVIAQTAMLGFGPDTIAAEADVAAPANAEILPAANVAQNANGADVAQAANAADAVDAMEPAAVPDGAADAPDGADPEAEAAVPAADEPEAADEPVAVTPISIDFGSFSCGIGAILYGMLALALVWAPRNEITVLFVLTRAFLIETTLLSFSIWYLVIDFGLLLMIGMVTGISILGILLQFTGAALGFGLGVLMLKQKWVDCEGWDLFTVLSGNYGGTTRDVYGYEIAADADSHNEKRATVSGQVDDDDAESGKKKTQGSAANLKKRLTQIHELIQTEDFAAASDELYNLRVGASAANAKLDQSDLRALATGLAKAQQWEDAVPLMQEYVRRFPDEANAVRLKLAGVFVQFQRRPRQAIQVLKPIDRTQLSDKQRAIFEKLAKQAKQQIADGVAEDSDA